MPEKQFTAWVSIHAPVQDATVLVQRGLFVCFNPRTRTGCDLLHLVTVTADFQVSIHAPVQDATKMLLRRSFNPRTRTGCDVPDGQVGRSHRDMGGHRRHGLVSIHAPVQDATRIFTRVLSRVLWFQSTHPYRMRHSVRTNNPDSRVSIHTPVRA